MLLLAVCAMLGAAADIDDFASDSAPSIPCRLDGLREDGSLLGDVLDGGADASAVVRLGFAEVFANADGGIASATSVRRRSDPWYRWPMPGIRRWSHARVRGDLLRPLPSRRPPEQLLLDSSAMRWAWRPETLFHLTRAKKRHTSRAGPYFH